MRKGLFVGLLLGSLAALAAAQSNFCAVVKLEIAQEATLEREAFDARLLVSNDLPDQPLTDFKVQIFFKDAEGAPADSHFFVKITTLTGTNAIDGSGVIQSSSAANIHWLIIPSSGTGGSSPAGQRYGVRAVISGTSNGAPQNLTTFDAFITVHPQPLIKLEYALPYEVFSDEPLTDGLPEPVEPFPLAVRVTNIGYGTAKNFQIESAQPKIVENKQGLQIDFKLLGTEVGGQAIPNTLLIPFGNIAPSGVSQASWIMSTSLSGRFIEFTSTFTHAAELGGQMTSLLQGVTTYTLLKDMLVELTGRDAVPDFLVNQTMDRGTMQALLDSGGTPPAELILESDQPIPLQVTDMPATLAGSLGGTSASLTLGYGAAVGENVWVRASVPFPYNGRTAQVTGARRADGKTLGPRNVWLSKHFRKSDLSVLYRLNVVDLTSSATSYDVQFSSVGLDAAPGAVTDLAAVTASSGGTLNLSWSAPGEDGFTGHILGGRYLIQHEIGTSTPFAPASSQVSFATSTDPGNRQFYALDGLIGNATAYLRLWTQDTGGAISEVSNGATAYALPNPPRDLVLTDVSSVSAHAAWQAGNNSLPIEYRVFAATAADGVAVSSSPYQDSFSREFDFAGLAPSTTYTVFGAARNPDTGVMSPLATLGQFMTSPSPDTTPPVTSLQVNGVAVATAALVVTSTDTLGFVATDAESGVARTLYALDGGTEAVYVSTFSLAYGTYALAYRSEDLAGNFEALQASSITSIAAMYSAASGDGAATVSSPRADATITAVSTDTAASAYAIAVTSQGLILATSAFYELLPSPAVFDPPALLSLRFSPAGLDAASASIYRFDGVAWDSAPITGQQVVSIDGGLLEISGTLQSASLYAVFALPPTLVSIEVTPSSATIAAGTTLQFEATGTFTDASTRTLTGEVVWSTDISSMVSVSTTGAATGLLEGTALIIASSGALTAQAVLTVTPATLVSIAVTPPSASIAAGLTAQFAAAGTFTDGSTRTLTGEVAWSTDLSSVATVNASGLATGVNEGMALVIASSGSITAQAVLTVTAPTLVSIAITPSATSIAAGLTAQFAAAGTFTDGSTRTLTGEVAWSTDASSVATVSASGLASGAGEGTALVIASSGTITAQAVLTVTPATLVSISVTPPSASIATGLTAQFEAAGTFTDGSTRTLTGEVVWSTDVSSAATVNASGLATGIGEGTALVIASSGTITAQAVLTVTPATLVSITVTPPSASIAAGLTAQFEAAGTFTNGSTRTLTGEVLWSTDASSVATVDAAGLATGVGEGSALVIASSGTITVQAILTVTPATLVSISVAPPSVSIAAGLTAQFEAAGTFTDGSTRTLTGEVVWSTDASSVATVSVSGLATGVDEGTALVVASSGTITAQAALTVTPATLVSLAVTPTSASIAAGLTAQFAASGTFTDGSTRTLTGEVAWSMDASSVATVNAAGLATGIAEGTALVVASSGTLMAQAVLTVTPPTLISIAVSPGSASIAVGMTAQFSAAGTFTNGSTRTLTGEVTWSTNISSVATVNAAGLATGVGEGTALVIASSGTITAQAVLTVSPATLVSLAVTPPSASIAAGLTAQFEAAGTFTDGSTRTLTGEVVWSTDASSVATVSALGLATGAGEGTALVIASSGTITAQAVLTVTPATLISLAVTPPSASIPAGQTAQFEAAGTFTNGSTRALTGEVLWSTDVSSVATVDAAGLATGVGAGTALVIASSGAVVSQARLTVNATYFTTASADGAASLSSSRADMSITAVSPGSAAPAYAAAAGQRLVLMMASYYDLQPSPVVFDPAALLSFSFDPASVDPGTIAIYRYDGPAWSSAPVAGQSLVISGPSLARISGYLSSASLYAVFSLPPAPSLTSIAVTPSTASILTGETAQFEAAGTFSDASTRTITGEVHWSTDVSSVATVSVSGLATGVGAGGARVSASSGTIAGFARLTVTLPPLTVASISPSSATAGPAVTAAVVGTGFDAATALTLERADALRGTWAATGSFAQGRYLHTLTKLRDGRALLAGGSTGSTAADIYNPATGAWSAAPPLNQGRDQHAAITLADGRVLVSGGYAGGAPVKTAELYNPALNAWTTAAPMNTARAWHQLALLPGGRVLAAGGIDGPGYTSSAEIYDPVANTWTPAAPMAQGHAGAAMAALGGGKILIAGGFGGNLTGEVYNPATNAWTTATGALQASGYFLQAAALADGRIMIAGDPGGTTDLYDPATNALTAAAPLGTARYVHAMASVGGTAFVIGGQNSTALASTEVYDAAANAWRPGPALTAPRSWPRAAVLDDGRVLAAGGLNGGTSLNTAEVLGAAAVAIAATGVTAADARHLAGTFDLAGAATGYWDVVVRRTDGQSARLNGGFEVLPAAPALASIAVSPSTASIMAGATAQFSAAGTFTDGSTRTLTGEVAWSTDVSSVATVNAAGLATGVGGGTALVVASLGAISGQGVLNVAFVASSTGTVGGSPEVTLVSTAPFSVVLASTETGAGALALGSAAAQGLVLVSPVYEVTREDAGATAVLTWSFDPALVDTTTLAIWRFDGVAWSSASVLNQVVSVADGVGTVTGEVVLTSLFALFSHDAAAPVTTLLVDGLPAGAASLTIAPASVLGFAAVDAGAGVLETRYALDGGAEAVFVSTFSLPPGTYALSYRSVDRAGNEEAARTAAITVTNPSADTTPPLVRLDYPDASARGVEQALGGVVDVRGEVSDASAVSWILETAPGAAATGGFTAIASGAGNLSGLIAAWNTASLSSYQTLRLSATDASGNAASSTATVFVGSPVMTFAIGRKNSDATVSNLKGPTGIAVRPDGSIWVASTENDQILLISPAGVLLGAAGRAPGHSGERKEHGKKAKKGKDHDDEEENRGDRLFKTPQGLALDAAGSLYVADRDLNRVVKLSPDGQALLLQFGRAGSGPGELRRPFDVAVDANGDVYAADSGNRRVSVFDATGAFLRQFGAGVFLSTSEIRGLALTAEGLWVSDKELSVIHLFNRSGALIKTISGADSSVGELSRMRGLASDRLGALYVVEPNRDRVQKFDPRGKGLLAFGSRDGLSRADRLAKRWLTQPIDAAVAPDGSIWVTDTGRDRIVRYAPPSASAGSAALSTGGGEFSSSAAEPARRVVDHRDGAAVARDDGSGVRVPKGALAADLEVTVEKGDENVDKEPKEAKRREMKITAVSEEIQYGPEGTTFSAPVTLTIPYDANLIASRGLREDDLKVYYWNPTLQEWQAMPSTVDKKAKTVNALTTHFSGYQVQAPNSGIGVAAVDDFGLRDGYAFPNPARNGTAVTFRMQPGSADSIEVRVYDLSGRKVHSSSDFRFLGAVDDGNGKGAQNTYDHVWNVSGVGSGVYTFVMTAKKSGQPDVRKTGKVGVIK